MCMMICLDNIIIFDKEETQHMKNVEEIIKRLAKTSSE